MKHFWKVLTAVFTSTLMLMLFTGCQPEQIVKVVETIREVPIEVVKEVPKEVPVEVIREVPVEVVKEVPVIKEVPVEVIKEVEVPGEPVIKEIIKEVPVPAEPKEENLREELISIFNDAYIYSAGSIVHSFKADISIDAKARAISGLAAMEIASNNWNHDANVEKMQPVLVGVGDTNYYAVTYFKNRDYASNYYKQNLKKQMILEELNLHATVISPPDEYDAQNAVARVGFADIQVGTSSYTLVLFEIPTVRTG